MEEDNLSKRGPGRPPKTKHTTMVSRGVGDVAINRDNRFELVCAEPTIFKNLFSYFNQLKTRDIDMRLALDGVTFMAYDFARSGRVVARMPGAKLTHYFCEEPFWLTMKRENVEKMFSNIDKSFNEIMIYQECKDQDSLCFLFNDHSIDKKCRYKISTLKCKPDPGLLEAENMVHSETEYALEWTLTARQFKKTIANASKYCDYLTVEKDANMPLLLQYADQQHNVQYSEVYSDEMKVDMKANVDSMFRCGFKVGAVKALAAAMLTDTVRIMCRDGSLLIRSEIDVMTVHTLLPAD